MSLVHAILGLLEEQPYTGYELKTQGFECRVNHFWSADQSQIYRTLDKLEEQGWAESHVEIQQDHPNRKVYHITSAGKAELQLWQHQFLPPSTVREPFLVQLFFGAGLTNSALLKLLEEQLAAREKRLQVYLSIDLPPVDDLNTTRALILQRLTLECGITSAKVYIKWAQDAINVVKSLKEN